MKRTSLVWLVVLNGTMLWSAADSPLQFLLQRIVNPPLEKGGTHNRIQYSCMEGGRGVSGLLKAGEECDDIKILIPVDRTNQAHLFSVSDRRLALFQAQTGSRSLILREYGRCDTDAFVDKEIEVAGLSDTAAGICALVLTIEHNAKFTSKTNQSTSGKRIESPASPIVHHLPYTYVSPVAQRFSAGSFGHSQDCTGSCCAKLPAPVAGSQPNNPFSSSSTDN